MPLLIEPRVSQVAGVTLVAAGDDETPQAALAAAKDAAGCSRRLVWRHVDRALSVFDAHETGRQLTEAGVDLLVVSGAAAREVAVGARDAGMALNNVVVCCSEQAAAGLLADVVVPGDVILTLGASDEDTEQLADAIAVRWGAALAAA